MRGFTSTREFYLLSVPENRVEVRDDQSDAIAYKYDSPNKGEPCAIIFFGKQAKPVAQYRYRNAEARDKAIADHFEARRKRQQTMANRREGRKAFKHNAQVGDIYVSSWGYDQTNVDYYEIVAIEGKFAVVRAIGSEVVRGDGHAEYVKPKKGSFLEPRNERDRERQPMRRLIQDGHIKVDDHRFAHPWNGGADYQTGPYGGH